jgi:hypothetical protein
MKLAFALLPLLCGCAACNNVWIAPDSFNYTVAIDHKDFSVSQHWFGLSWNLKHPPPTPAP